MCKKKDKTALSTAIEVVGLEAYRDAAQPAAQEIGKALGTVFGIPNLVLSPVKFLEDWVAAKFEHLREKVEQKISEIPPERRINVQLEDILPILEAYKNIKVEDEGLQEMFVNLLTSYADSETQSSSRRAFVRILEELSPYDAWLLKDMYVAIEVKKGKLFMNLHNPDVPELIFHIRNEAVWSKELEYSEGSYIAQKWVNDIAQSSIDNLDRLKLIHILGNGPNGYQFTHLITMSSFGRDFCRTCIK